MYEDAEYDVIELKEIVQILRKHWKPIIIVPIVFAIIGLLVSFYLIDPVYEASTTLMVRQNKETDEQIDITDVNLSKSLIYTYAEMAKSNTVLENTRESLGLLELDSSSITVSPVKDTQILKVSAQNIDPKLAMEIADTLVEEFTDEVMRITKTDNVAVVDYAKLPLDPIKPNKLMNTVIAFILGEMIVLLVIFLIEYLDNTIKTEKDVEKFLEVSVIGAIPDFNQGGNKTYGKVHSDKRSKVTDNGSI
ncbi:MAG: Wzz/FepE/Etk N-terminal domain-containing protein [Sedimentibacter sp.]